MEAESEPRPVHCITQIESVVPPHNHAPHVRNHYVQLDNANTLLEPAGADLSVLSADPQTNETDGAAGEMRDIKVLRPVFTQQDFDIAYEPNEKIKKKAKDYFTSFCTKCECTKKSVKKQVLKMIPAIDAARNYDVRRWLPIDIICGLTIGIIAIPQSMGYALLAGVLPYYGLYSSFLPVLLYCLLGTSRHMCYGTLAITYLLVGNAVTQISNDILGTTTATTSAASTLASTSAASATAASASAFASASPFSAVSTAAAAATTASSSSIVASTHADVAICLAFYMGIFQLVIGVLRLGFVTIYFADAMVAGYTTATILYVLTSQLASLFGLAFQRQTGYFNLINTWIMVFKNIASTNVATLIISLCCIAALSVCKFWLNPIVMKKIRAPIPIELLLIIAGIVASDQLQLKATYKVAVVGNIPSGLPPPRVPNLSLSGNVIGSALIISLVNFAVSVSLARVLAKKHGYEINENQEAIAYGLSNLIPSFFQSLPTGGSVARTCVEESIQGKSQLVSTIASVMILILLYTVAGLFSSLPISVLASIIVINLSGMIDQFKNVKSLWEISKFDCAIWIVSFAGTILLDTDIGLVIAIIFSFFVVVVRTQATKRGLLGNVNNTDLYEYTKKYKDAVETAQVKVFRFAGPINFACATMFRSAVYKKTGVNPRNVIVECNKLERKKKRAAKKLKSVTDPVKQEKYRKIIGRQEESIEIKFVIIELSACSYIDYGGLRILKQVIQEYKSIGVAVFIAGCTSSVKAILCRTDFYATNDASIVFVSVHDAVTAAKLLLSNATSLNPPAKHSYTIPTVEFQSLSAQTNADFDNKNGNGFTNSEFDNHE